MNINSEDMVSMTDVGRSASRLVTEAMGGRTWVVMKNNRPSAVLTGVEQMERLQRLDDLEQDLRLMALAVIRTMTDSGERHDLDDVAAEFGVDLNAED